MTDEFSTAIAKRVLLEVMQEISETCFCAGWMDGLEFDLWERLTHGPREYGQCDAGDLPLDLLRFLSEYTDGWWVIPPDWETDPAADYRFISRAEMTASVAAHPWWSRSREERAQLQADDAHRDIYWLPWAPAPTAPPAP